MERRTLKLSDLLKRGSSSVEERERPAPDPPLTPPLQAKLPEVPSINLKEHPPKEEVLGVLPEWIIRNFPVLPHHYGEGGALVVVTLNPYDTIAEQEIRRHVGKVIFATADPADFHFHRERALNTLARQQKALKEIVQETPAGQESADEGEGAVPDFVNGLIREAILQRASDIHIEPQAAGGRIRFRIDGDLQEHSVLPRHLTRAVVSRLKVSAGLDPAESNLPQDGRIAFSYNERRYRLRLSTVPTPYGEGAVVRILPDASHIPLLEDLGFAEDTLALYRGVLAKPYGVILITGPTGSGKTTTLFASLRERFKPNLKVVTVEDPIEYEFPEAVQIQVQPEVGRTFARVLRAFLRHDPDIIVVGEIRDAETAKIAMEAGLTGHLVLATLHANTAASAPIRLMEMGVQPYLFSNLLAVLSQRLVRRVCSHCTEPYVPAALPKDPALPLPSQASFRRGRGCPQCRNTGYQGRLGLHELLIFDPETQEILLRQRNANVLETVAVKKGMRRLLQDGLLKASQGLTTVEEVLAKTRA